MGCHRTWHRRREGASKLGEHREEEETSLNRGQYITWCDGVFGAMLKLPGRPSWKGRMCVRVSCCKALEEAGPPERSGIREMGIRRGEEGELGLGSSTHFLGRLGPHPGRGWAQWPRVQGAWGNPTRPCTVRFCQVERVGVHLQPGLVS